MSSYTSPELYQYSNSDNSIGNAASAFDPFSSDIYSLGVIFFEILHGSDGSAAVK